MSIKQLNNDVLGLAIFNLLNPRYEDEKFKRKVAKIKKKRIIVMELIDIYGLTLTFDNGDIIIERGMAPKFHLKITLSLEALVKMAEGKMGLIGAFLKRKVKVKKIFRLITILRFKTIFFPALKATNERSYLDGVVNIL